MAKKVIKLKNFNIFSLYNQYFIDLKENTFIFSVEWSDYCNCAFLSITDDNYNSIISGLALTNNLIIRNNKLPYVLFFGQINGKTYEPTLDNLANEFVFLYDDEVA